MHNTILLVDDDRLVTRSLSRFLQRQGYTVFATEDPLEASLLLSKHSIDILLSDIDMPELDGIELVTLSRRVSTEIECILITGDLNKERMRRAAEVGVFRTFEKPIDLKLLLSALAEITAQKTKGAEAQPLKTSSAE